ncbi:MAG: ankyrin repeat domain-containing protein [Alphaproteobacteria bacterium]|nr:ankyrin repeat domain-containing protein [Alphaproteobacteria bacterium]
MDARELDNALGKKIIEFVEDKKMPFGIKKRKIEYLIKQGANIEAKNELDRTALMVSCISGDKEVAELLLSKGAFVEATDFNDVTPLMWASVYGHKDVVELLLNKGANVWAVDNCGQNALKYAMDNWHKDVIEVLEKSKKANSYIPKEDVDKGFFSKLFDRLR